MYNLTLPVFWLGSVNSGDEARVSEFGDLFPDVGAGARILLALLKAVDSAMTAQHAASPTNIWSVCQIGCSKLRRSERMGEVQCVTH